MPRPPHPRALLALLAGLLTAAGLCSCLLDDWLDTALYGPRIIDWHPIVTYLADLDGDAALDEGRDSQTRFNAQRPFPPPSPPCSNVVGEPNGFSHGSASPQLDTPPTAPPTFGKPRPNIVFILVDDLGWGNVGFTESLFTPPRPFEKWTERARELAASSPKITALASTGRILTRHYVHCTCSPSRSSLQSGRLPVHVQTALLNPCHPSAGIPKQMTTIANLMRQVNYSTHFVGKWDAGMVTPSHIPLGRGYQSSLNFFSHGNWMWTEDVWIGSLVNASRPPTCTLDRGCARDLWDTNQPALQLNGTLYEERLLGNRVLDIIAREAGNPWPLFIMYHPRVAHYPLQAPRKTQRKMGFVLDPHRKVYLSMISYLDDVIGEIVQALESTDRWSNTLLVFTSDNGGVVKEPGRCVEATRGLACFNGEAGANNYPLKGGKYTNWEGGIRAATFIAGGLVPRSLRGVPVTGLVHIADWYVTLALMAGVTDPFTDARAAAAGLPGVDSTDQRRLLFTNANESARTSVLLSPNALILGDMKLLVGVQYGSAWAGPLYPNATTALPGRDVYSTTLYCKPGCLFNVSADPEERNDLSQAMPNLLQSMLAELKKQAQSIWYRPRTRADPACLQAAAELYSGFLGPWQELDDQEQQRLSLGAQDSLLLFA